MRLPVDLSLQNARVYLDGEVREAGLAVNAGKIVKVAKDVNLPKAVEIVDVGKSIVLPGLIDAHVHLRDQDLAYKEDFSTGTAAAACGGVTLVLDMPNNEPVTMGVSRLRERMEVAEGKVLVNVGFYSAFPEDLGEVQATVDQGAIGFKVFLSKRVGGFIIDDDKVLVQALKSAGRAGVPVAAHAEDAALIQNAKARMVASNRNDVESYLKAHSEEAEVKSINRLTRLLNHMNLHLHICHVSTASGLEDVAKAKALGCAVTCEVTPHHLLLSSRYLEKLGTVALMDPPLRSRQTVNLLWEGLGRGLVDIVASDHAPHSLDQKVDRSVWDVKPGVPGLETMLPLLLTQVNRGHLTMQELVSLTSEKPSLIFGLTDRGRLAEGYQGDLVVVDMKREGVVDPARFKSKAHYSPFEGYRTVGAPVMTFVNGVPVMEEGEVVAESGVGRVLRKPVMR